MREEFFINRGGKRYVLFAGLLDEAHTRGLVGIDTELLQIPEESNGNTAIVKATVQIEEQPTGSDPARIRTFAGTGDASPDNVGRAIQPHLLRMAETRAKARALRDAVNIGATALEEISDSDDEATTSSGPQSHTASGDAAHGGSRSGSGSSSGGSSGGGSRERRERAEAQPRGLQRGRRNQRSSEAPDSQKAETQKAESEGANEESATDSQIQFLKDLAVEWRGEDGVDRLEKSIGKPLSQLSRPEAHDWIERLTPEDPTHESQQAQ